MTYSEIMTLMDKGFNADQIMQLTGGKLDVPAVDADGGKPVDNPASEPEKVETPAAEPANNPQDEKNPSPVAKEVDNLIAELKSVKSQMEEMKKVFQSDALKFDSMQTPANDGMSAVDALGELIRPTYKKEN